MNRVSKKQRKALSDVMQLEISLTDFVREELHEFVISQGMVAVQKLLEEDRDRLCGAAYERCERTARRAGSAPGELVLGGRKVKIKRPRGRDLEGEVALDSYQRFSHTDPLEKRAMEQMIIGVSTRK